ncbi:MAG: DUF4242 domain-containing protein [Calditrichaeota bacterium]|nr:MAG: DUF4242 domain-containing protein [Calditrichota bacterium]MBL1204324.1 DUF4242 domain-containing protein [Calditrichota bacterium]NOG44153.1 DUF4242 domain-containing protein [Calditrichota bacterium]
MPLYMDIHTVDSDDFSVEDVVKAHMQDLAIQERFGVTQIKYWVNVDAKTLFCLMEGPDKDACNKVHKESHGNTACNIIEVSDDEFNLFLGQGKSVNDLAYTNSGEIDTGYRTILLLNYADFTVKYINVYKEISNLVEQNNGTIVVQPDDEIMVSFVLASEAMLCAEAVVNLLKSVKNNLEFSISLVSGRPVDEHGKDLFEETKKKTQDICNLGFNKTIYLDYETKALAEKEKITSKVNIEDFKTIQKEDFSFLLQVSEELKNNLINPEFKSDNLHELLGLSKSQTYRKIKSLTGLAPNQLIQEARLILSLKQIKKSGKTISEIAYDSGFNSPTYFAKIFKKRFGSTPTDFSSISKN